MSYPLRSEFHRARKALARSLDSLWPRADFKELSTTLTESVKPPVLDPGPAECPAQAQSFLERWATEEDREEIRKLVVPCTVDPKMGILFVNGKVLWGSSDLPERERNPRFFAHLKTPRRRLPSAILLHHFHGDNYCHFFLYVATKACVAERHGLPDDIPFLVPAKTAETAFFKQAQDLGLFGNRQVIVQGRKEVVAVDEAYVIREFFCDASYFAWIRERLKAPKPVVPGRRVFVLRGKSAANGRAFRNQTAVNDLAAEFGFDLIDPSTLSLKEQVETFSHASVIAGAHGAALTNAIFRAGAPCKIIELFSPEMGGLHYYVISKSLGFDYASQMTLNPEGRAFMATTEVDLNVLRREFENLS
ncbi:glycosyltransferase family 61 protein [Roseibium sp.]|uniref:glycosyltransferase family 61 protein n=1 Tax=Roseibium sp. TaxID=1936156 RepID=UPI003A977B27